MKYTKFNGGIHFFYFRIQIHFFGEFGPKNQNCEFKIKLRTQTNSNMHISVILFTFSAFDRKYFFGEI